MKLTTKLGIAAVAIVVAAAIFAILIPQPYGIILSAIIGFGGGVYLRSFFNVIKDEQFRDNNCVSK